MPEFAIISASVNLLGSSDIYFPTEDHKLAARLTHYPVESGKDLADNYVREPNVVVLEGLVSDVEPGVRSGSGPVVWSQIESLLGGSLVTIATHIRTYGNMALVEAESRRANGIRDGLEFRAEFREVLFATSSLLEITSVVVAPAGPASARTAAVDGGSRAAPVVSGARFPYAPHAIYSGSPVAREFGADAGPGNVYPGEPAL